MLRKVPDSVDEQILGQLRIEGSASAAELVIKLGRSLPAVRDALKRLVASDRIAREREKYPLSGSTRSRRMWVYYESDT